MADLERRAQETVREAKPLRELLLLVGGVAAVVFAGTAWGLGYIPLPERMTAMETRQAVVDSVVRRIDKAVTWQVCNQEPIPDRGTQMLLEINCDQFAAAASLYGSRMSDEPAP